MLVKSNERLGKRRMEPWAKIDSGVPAAAFRIYEKLSIDNGW